VRKLLVSEGAVVPINTPIAVVGGADEKIDFEGLVGSAGEAPAAPAAAPSEPAAPAAAPQPTPAAAPVAQPAANGNLPGGVKASPLARRIAEEKGIEIGQVPGSGPGGRIIKKDVEAFLAGPMPPAAAPTASVSLPRLGAGELGPAPADASVPLSKLRQIIGRRMTQSKQEFPAFYVSHEYDLDQVMAMRKQANAMLADNGEKLSVNDFIIKAAALALRQYPNLNAALSGDAVLQYGQVNIGVAVAVENGLMTVVVHNADRKTIRQISTEVKEKAGRARAGRVQPADIEGSTFSVSNLGMFDVDSFIAIINPPEAAILAVGSANQAPVVKDGELAVGWRMKATISADHRVSDGAEAAQYMQALAGYLENPLSLML
jgi:pyruvate dehydrogenase E2 component (dihydrolipoamide acetyltransferase)